MNDQYFKTNESLWNQKVDYHTQSEFYQLEAFKKGEYQPLRPIELEGLSDIKGKKMLHLQCHFGQDSLAWSRLGAKVTGVDFSEKAIAQARHLNAELQLDAQFVCSNVLETRQHLQDTFDVVFTSYGVIGWLPELQSWAKTISESLHKGGVFYMVEFHPVLMTMDFDLHEQRYAYFNQNAPDLEIVQGTYADKNADIEHQEFTWSHSLSEIITPLLREGLVLETFNEYPYSNWNCFSNMKEVAPDQFVYQGFQRPMPHLFELKMRKV